MKIVIENTKFPFDLGCKILKLKHENSPFSQLDDIWEDIVPATFKEIAKLENLEHRRVGMLCFGLERLVKEVNPKLIDTKTLKKSTMWVDEKGELCEHKFNDTYELYEVSGDYFNEGISGWNKMESCHFVKCKDTSTKREYLIWVDINSVFRTNNKNVWGVEPKCDAIEAIAWTIQTDIADGGIEKIIRQGDCVLIKPKRKFETLNNPRHLTAKEYKKLLVAES